MCDLAGIPAVEQLEATGRHIEADFSNYSAWHARSTLLVRVHGKKEGIDGSAGADAAAAASRPRCTP